MAGISIGMPFVAQGSFALDERMTLTKAQMLATDDAKMPDVYLAVCSEDGQLYVYDKSATPSAETGKYRVSEGGDDYTPMKNKPSVNGVTLQGDKSFADLGDVPLTNLELKSIIDTQYQLIFG